MKDETRRDIQQPPVYLLSPDEEERLSTFFSAGTLPSALEEAIEQYITKKVGRDWRDPVIMGRLRKAIVAQKDDYGMPQARRSLKYITGYSVLGYLAYYFPVSFMQAEHILAMLARDGLLKQRMTILDIGTGPGVFPLAIADFYSRLDGATANIYSIEQSEEHIFAFLHLRNTCVPLGGSVSIKTPRKEDITTSNPARISEQIDLIVFSNVLHEIGSGNSIDQQVALVIQYAERLAPDGTLLIIEPAEENTSTQLRVLSLALKKQWLTIHSPCTFVWGTDCTPDRCWSFVTAPSIRPTKIMETLAASDGSSRYVNTDIKYSYVVLRKDGKTKENCRVPAGSPAIRLSQIQNHADKRVNIIAAKMSENLGDAKTQMFRICDGSAETPVYAVMPSDHITAENEAILPAPYEAILELQGVLVRHNPKHDTYNLLVSRNTIIIPAGQRRENVRVFSQR